MLEEELWYWLNNIPGIGRKNLRRLLEIFDNPCNLYCEREDSVKKYLGEGKRYDNFVKSKDIARIKQEMHTLKEKNISFIYPGTEDYPESFIKLEDAPLGLYLKGRMLNRNQKSIAIIGARNASRYGLEMARFFGRELAKCGIAVVSGLARGIDGNGHLGALEGDGYTLGILGCGIDQVYPKENYELYMKMEKEGGILSEHNIGVVPKPGLFPERNRLISGLCDGILVIEAMEKSGTFITVDQGLENGKEIFALPGRITDTRSVGCNNLIKFGAHAVTNIEDILQILKFNNPITQKNAIISPLDIISKKNSLAPLEKIVYDCLRIEARYLDDIIEETKVAPQDVCKILNSMSMDGIIVEPTRNYFAIKL